MILYEYLALPPVFDTLNYLLKFTGGTRALFLFAVKINSITAIKTVYLMTHISLPNNLKQSLISHSITETSYKNELTEKKIKPNSIFNRKL